MISEESALPGPALSCDPRPPRQPHQSLHIFFTGLNAMARSPRPQPGHLFASSWVHTEHESRNGVCTVTTGPFCHRHSLPLPRARPISRHRARRTPRSLGSAQGKCREHMCHTPLGDTPRFQGSLPCTAGGLSSLPLSSGSQHNSGVTAPQSHMQTPTW